MCCSCGCRHYFDSHLDPRNITYPDMQAAAEFASITVEQAAENIQSGVLDLLTANPPASVADYSQRPVVLSDVDNVLRFWAEAEILALNARWGTAYDAFDRPYQLNLPKEQKQWLDSWRNDPTHVPSVAPDFHAIDAETRIAKEYVLTIGSDSPQRLAAANSDWLDRWAPGLDNCSRILEGPGGKLRFSQQFDVNTPLVWIDDDPKFWVTGLRPGVRIFTPKRAWTPPNPPPGVTVFTDWEQVLTLLGC